MPLQKRTLLLAAVALVCAGGTALDASDLADPGACCAPSASSAGDNIWARASSGDCICARRLGDFGFSTPSGTRTLVRWRLFES